MERLNAYIIRRPEDLSPAYCVKCGVDRDISHYYKHSVRSDGAVRYRPYCKACRIKGPRSNWARPVHAAMLAAGQQTCRYCRKTKPLDCFYANGCFKDGTKKYRSRCKACVLELSKRKQPQVYKSKSERRSSSPKNFISGILNHAAKRKQHLGFDLDLGYLMHLYAEQRGLCALSGVEMAYAAGQGRTATNISIDRIDSAVGYVRGNVHLVCDIANRMKQDLSVADLRTWCKRILGVSGEKI